MHEDDAVDLVGWVERSETHQCWAWAMGFAALYPSYDSDLRRHVFVTTRQLAVAVVAVRKHKICPAQGVACANA
jgi:hypothetical protein